MLKAGVSPWGAPVWLRGPCSVHSLMALLCKGVWGCGGGALKTRPCVEAEGEEEVARGGSWAPQYLCGSSCVVTH